MAKPKSLAGLPLEHLHLVDSTGYSMNTPTESGNLRPRQSLIESVRAYRLGWAPNLRICMISGNIVALLVTVFLLTDRAEFRPMRLIASRISALRAPVRGSPNP